MEAITSVNTQLFPILQFLLFIDFLVLTKDDVGSFESHLEHIGTESF